MRKVYIYNGVRNRIFLHSDEIEEQVPDVKFVTMRRHKNDEHNFFLNIIFIEIRFRETTRLQWQQRKIKKQKMLTYVSDNFYFQL